MCGLNVRESRYCIKAQILVYEALKLLKLLVYVALSYWCMRP